MNPFPYHGPVSGSDLCDREEALDALLEAARAGRVAALAGPRGHGLSSVAGALADRLRSDGLEPRVVGLADLADGDDLAGRLPSPPDTGAPGSLGRPLLVDDADRLGRESSSTATASRLREAAGGSALVLFGHDPDSLEWLLPPEAELLVLDPLPLAAWLPYALERFLATDVWVGNEHVEAAHRLVGGHPRHLQHLSHELWDLAAGRGRRVEDAMLEEALQAVAGREARVWTAIWSTLTPNQRRFLRAVARAGGERHPFGRDFLAEAGLATASSAQRAASSLRERGLLEDIDGALRVGDPLLALWLTAAG